MKSIFVILTIAVLKTSAQTPLIEAVKNHRNIELTQLLNSGVDVNEVKHHDTNHDPQICTDHEHDRSALFWAVLYRNTVIASLLLNHGADVNFKNAHGKTALHIAVQTGNPDLVELLLKHRADITVVDAFGNRPIDFALRMRKIETHPDLLNRWNTIVELLSK